VPAQRELSTLAINTLRTLSIDAVQKANSGHPGLPMGAAPMAYVLWQRYLRHDPTDPHWPDRDRFVLSAGHGSMLLYSLLHLAGYDLGLDDLQAFRQWGSRTPGHPEWHDTPGVEATTGPLGQGSANAVGMAIAERYLAHLFNRPGHTIVDHHTYALVSDGDLMEGVAAEAGSLAGHLGLGKLIYLYDANEVTLDGPTSLCFSGEDVGARYASYGWHVVRVEDGDRDLAAIDAAIAAAKADTERPSIIIIRTTIGFGSPKKAGNSSAHGSPLGPAEVIATKQAYGWDPEQHFFVPDEVRAHFDARERGGAAHATWTRRFAEYEAAHPDLAAQWKRAMAGELPPGWDEGLPVWKAGESLATRTASGKVLGALAAKIPWLLGGDADLGGSTKTIVAGGDFDGRSGEGRNLRYGVREHAMGSICNGMVYHGGVRPFAATFFVFSDYMRPAVRLAALNRQPVVYVWTHDSVGLGEDGPTHQPVEHLMSLRAMPHLHVVRPADANETAAAWRHAMRRTDGPTALVLSRQDLPVVTPASPPLERGAYVVADAPSPRALIIATGSEVSLALAARDLLAAEGVAVRVVSMPSWELFAAQDQAYRDSVLPPSLTARVSVEAGVTFGWERHLGSRGRAIGVDRFGASAPAEILFEKLGLTAAHVAAELRALLQ
jgi:transketolase